LSIETARKTITRAEGFSWPELEIKEYKPGHSLDVTRRTLLESNGAQVRYFEVAPGGFTSFEKHEHEHLVVVLRGTGRVRLDSNWSELRQNDAVYVGPMVPHQFRNDGVEPFGILCVVDRDRDRPILLDPQGNPQTSE
jgi:quercetin dioxygenase-like cupin family protein